eukprot:1153447-Pelagomonas_calceolata.AAC.10
MELAGCYLSLINSLRYAAESKTGADYLHGSHGMTSRRPTAAMRRAVAMRHAIMVMHMVCHSFAAAGRPTAAMRRAVAIMQMARHKLTPQEEGPLQQ